MGWEGIHWGTVYSSEIFFCMILVIKLKLKAIQVYVFVQNSEMRIKQQKWHLQMNWWNNILNTIVADLAHCEGTTDQPWPFTDVGTKINWKSWGQSDSATWIETSVGLGSPCQGLGTETSVGLGTFREIFRLSDPTTCNSDWVPPPRGPTPGWLGSFSEIFRLSDPATCNSDLVIPPRVIQTEWSRQM